LAKPVNPDEIATAERAFREFLRHRGHKYTTRRQVMLRAVMSVDEHFDVERILVELRGRGHRVGRATVYRALAMLESCGIIKRVTFGGKHTHYEHIHGHSSHDHMECRRCGRIIEFDNAAVVELRKVLARQYQFHDVSHRFQVMGLCRECWQSCPAGRLPAAR